ncbi:Thymidylate kinase [Chlamydia avium]|uniref:Thymidylate kinase n=1 Tax=Chlamydia avium TaxID=1457141 RepID=A0ABN0MS94_9CHLA|nr:dTMP kinase [Chlamydia avium]EPP35876.1 thymidylate kinase [Chlamydia psittaci 10_743_SC13]EPP38304.1 thymidylate kinase [Chlamydia avium]VVT42791.1 Thymidylate kinase [Chlamydia avium]
MFIVIEGCEGSGKSSLAQLLSSKLIASGKSVVLTREPGGSILGEKLRQWILEPQAPNSPYADLFLFLASRAQHISETILPAIESGKIVICERFHDSTIVYQGIAEGLGKDYVTNLCYHVVGEESFLPDLTCLLDIPVSEGIQRKQKQKPLDKFENKSLDYHNQIRDGFLSLAHKNPNSYLILDGRKPIEDSLSKVMSAYTELVLCK